MTAINRVSRVGSETNEEWDLINHQKIFCWFYVKCLLESHLGRFSSLGFSAENSLSASRSRASTYVRAWRLLNRPISTTLWDHSHLLEIGLLADQVVEQHRDVPDYCGLPELRPRNHLGCVKQLRLNLVSVTGLQLYYDVLGLVRLVELQQYLDW